MAAEKTTVHDMPTSIVDAQLQRLLEIVKDYQQKQCETLLSQARHQSRQIIRHTYSNARRRLRDHILEDRQKLTESVSSTRAKRHTFAMQQKHQANRKFLDDAWELLKTNLQQRWNDQHKRQLWIQSIVEVALNYLPASEWRIAHGKSWIEADQNQFIDTIKVKADKKLVFEAQDEISAGILISAAGASVDGTLQGLLSDRERIESEFLAQCTHCIVHGIAGENSQPGKN